MSRAMKVLMKIRASHSRMWAGLQVASKRANVPAGLPVIVQNIASRDMNITRWPAIVAASTVVADKDKTVARSIDGLSEVRGGRTM